MPKKSINSTKFCLFEIYIYSYVVIFDNKNPKMSQFAKNWNVFAILANELVGNIIQVNIKCIYVF